ncbi:hypothetical protein [Nocardioides sp. zg-1230]|uniref:hypothetical protein n=1 Tax=Nocardioides sp. zg-1230 TaxID=2736601 RepID=UPI001551F7D3|nr:hypothetical protein [Nocardioides sp. zg-1230]NPC42942.1 hypothetical protein [Nocardioides sp. zg-1230]
MEEAVNTHPTEETVLSILREALLAALSTLDGAADGTILPEQVSAHLMQWETTFDQYRARLPESAQHMSRSVRMALGEALGGVALASLDDRMVGHELSQHDEQWNETARRYLLDCLKWIDAWAARSRLPFFQPRLPSFDAWLDARQH